MRTLLTLRRDTVLATKWALAEDAALVLERPMRTSDGDDALEQARVPREPRNDSS